MKYFFILISFILISGISFSGCQKKTDESVPSLETAVNTRDPKLLTGPSRTMDLLSVQQTPEDITATAAANPYADFLIRKASSDKEVVEKAGAHFEPAVEAGGKVLSLRGVALRRFEMSSISLITVYSAGFYIDENESAENVLEDVEKVLILDYRLDVPKEKVTEAIKTSVHENPEVDIEAVEPYFEQLANAFDEPQKGDRYEFVYLPGRGTAMIKQGRVMTVIPSLDFEKAFFGIWLSPHNKDQEIRCELLDLPCKKTSLHPGDVLSAGLDGTKEKLNKLKGLFS